MGIKRKNESTKDGVKETAVALPVNIDDLVNHWKVGWAESRRRIQCSCERHDAPAAQVARGDSALRHRPQAGVRPRLARRQSRSRPPHGHGRLANHIARPVTSLARVLPVKDSLDRLVDGVR